MVRAAVASLASPNKGAFPHREVSSGGREPPTLSSCRRVCLSASDLGTQAQPPGEPNPGDPDPVPPPLLHQDLQREPAEPSRQPPSPALWPIRGVLSKRPSQRLLGPGYSLACTWSRCANSQPWNRADNPLCLATFLPWLPGPAQSRRC